MNLKIIEKLITDMEDRLNTRIDKIEINILEKIKLLGNSCKQAFDQTKNVVNYLGERQVELNENLCEYGGVIESSTWN